MARRKRKALLQRLSSAFGFALGLGLAREFAREMDRRGLIPNLPKVEIHPDKPMKPPWGR